MLGSQNKFGQKALQEGYVGIGYLPHINFSNQFTELLKDFNKKYIPELMSIRVLLETSSSTSQKSLEMLYVYNDNVRIQNDLPKYYEAFNLVKF